MNRHITYICEYCGESYVNKRKHRSICKNQRHSGFTFTDKEKQQISNSIKLYKKQHPEAHNWKNKNKFDSKYCNYVKEFLTNNNITFIDEYNDISCDHHYRIDIAIISKKIGIEINGNQHYNRDGTLSEYYQFRHDYLVNKGWNIIEIIYTKTTNIAVLNDILNIIITSKDISSEEYTNLITNNRKRINTIKYIENEKRKQELIKHNKIRKDGIYASNVISENELLDRKQQILNSGIDLNKFGWISKVEKITGLTRRQIYTTVNNTDLINIVFRRKS